MTRCPNCLGEMKPLLTSWYCPRDCDRTTVTPRAADRLPRFGPPVERNGVLWDVFVAMAPVTMTEEGLAEYEGGWFVGGWDTMTEISKASVVQNAVTSSWKNEAPGWPISGGGLHPRAELARLMAFNSFLLFRRAR